MKIEVNKSREIKSVRHRPFVMVDNMFANRWFQMYDNLQPINTFFLNCGINEKSVVCFWFDNEDKEWRISTQDKESLKDYSLHMSVLLLEEKDHPEITIK